MSDSESRPPTSSGMGCTVWFAAVVAYPLVTMALIQKIKPDGTIILLAFPVGLFLILVASVVLARALQMDPEARSSVGLAVGLFFGGIFLSAAVFFFGCSMAFKGI